MDGEKKNIVEELKRENLWPKRGAYLDFVVRQDPRRKYALVKTRGKTLQIVNGFLFISGFQNDAPHGIFSLSYDGFVGQLSHEVPQNASEAMKLIMAPPVATLPKLPSSPSEIFIFPKEGYEDIITPSSYGRAR